MRKNILFIVLMCVVLLSFPIGAATPAWSSSVLGCSAIQTYSASSDDAMAGLGYPAWPLRATEVYVVRNISSSEYRVLRMVLDDSWIGADSRGDHTMFGSVWKVEDLGNPDILSTPLLSQISAVTTIDKKFIFVATSTNVYYRYASLSSRTFDDWSSWKSTNTNLGNGPSGSMTFSGRADAKSGGIAAVYAGGPNIILLAVNNSGSMWYNEFAIAQAASGGGVHNWLTVSGGGLYSSAPSATSWGTNRIDVVALGTSPFRAFQLYSTDGGATWGGPVHITDASDGQFSSGLTITNNGVNRLDIFGSGNDYKIYQQYYDGAWHSWSNSIGTNDALEPRVPCALWVNLTSGGTAGLRVFESNSMYFTQKKYHTIGNYWTSGWEIIQEETVSHENTISACNDGIDNDLDGNVDSSLSNPDSECTRCGDYVTHASGSSLDPTILEQCDAGPLGGPRCTNNTFGAGSCKNNLCGDNYWNTSFISNSDGIIEQCDSGVATSGSSCTFFGQTDSRSCKLNACGDNYVGSGEQCDSGVSPNGTCTGSTFFGQTDSRSCKLNVCGDGYVGTGEQCDNATDTGNSTCYGRLEAKPCMMRGCGDYICDYLETTTSCSLDCGININGWNSNSMQGWSLTLGTLKDIKDGSAVTSIEFDLKADTNYTISARIINGENCNAYIDLNDGKCTSSLNWNEDACFTDISLGASVKSNPGTWQPVSTTFNISYNSKATAGVNGDKPYFKNVHLRLVVDGCSPANTILSNAVFFDDVSLTETQADIDNVYKTEFPESLLTQTGCCPADYCWDGTTCVSSDLWTNNATYSPIWNQILNAAKYGLYYGHVNTSLQDKTVGYRCIKSLDGNASWTLSSIKYDWNYKTSGYCAEETDCFVDATYDAGVGYSKGCIHDRDIISDNPFTLKKGNHYCNSGNWTTKSYIIAVALQNLAGSSPYTLYCDRNLQLVYDLTKTDFNKISGGMASSDVASACVIVINNSNTRTVITGVSLIDPTQTNNFIKNVITQYNDILNPQNGKLTYQDGSEIDIGTFDTINCPNSSSTSDKNTNYTICAKVGAEEFRIYYNPEQNYLLLSSQRISQIDGGSGFTFTWNWFKQNLLEVLFGKKETGVSNSLFTAINYTSSYDKMYLLNNGSDFIVRAIEDAKYDEENLTILNTTYIKYFNPTDTTNNPLSEENIKNNIGSKQYIRANISNANQEIIISTNRTMGVWQYFTNILRVK